MIPTRPQKHLPTGEYGENDAFMAFSIESVRMNTRGDLVNAKSESARTVSIFKAMFVEILNSIIGDYSIRKKNHSRLFHH